MMILLCIFISGCGREKEELLLTEQTQNTEKVFQDKQQDRSDKNTTSEAQKSSGEDTVEIPTVTEPPTEIYVDVCGAVSAPGVYKLDSDSRVFQAIEAAGGMLPEAAGASVNQAQPVSDGQQIYVPTQEEADQGTVDLPSEAGQQADGTQENAESGKINLNTADTETLKTLSGIGDAKAQAIIAWREENGSFSSIEDIMQVPGIKESTFTKIKDKIAVE